MKILEAWARGIPVVATAGEAAEAWRPRTAPQLMLARDASGFADWRSDRIARTRNYAKAWCGAPARCWYANHDPAAVARRMFAVYRQVMHAK